MFGETRRWTKDGIIYAENDFVRMAYAGTSDPKKIGTLGWRGPDRVCVEYVGTEIAEAMIRRIATLEGRQ